MTIPEILDAAGFSRVDLMKLDIEGGERPLFENAATWSSRVTSVVAEIHAPLTVESAAEQLAACGYKRLPLPADVRYSDLLLVTLQALRAGCPSTG